jgi:tetratricopeptide (TPR) repeat protein
LRPEEDADLQVLLATVDHELADPPVGPSELSSALDLLQPLWAMLPPSPERCRCDLTHAMASRRAGRPKDALEALQRALDGARALRDPALECQTLAALADLLRPPGDLFRSDGLAEQAWKIAEELDDDLLRKEVLLARLPTVLAREELDQGRLLLDKLRALLRTRSSWQDLLDLWTFRGRIELLAGQPDAARQAWQSALLLGRRRGLPLGSVLLDLCSLALESGDLSAAGEALIEAREGGGVPAHELRQALAILELERDLRLGDAVAGERGLLEVEILLAQAPLGDPRWQRSLRRARDVSPELGRRLAALEAEMARRLEIGRSGRRRR